MSFFDQDITLEDFQSSNVNAIFELDKIYNAHDLEKLLSSHIDSIPFKILASVVSMMFDPSDSVEPYKARFFFEDKRGIIINEFIKEILEINKYECLDSMYDSQKYCAAPVLLYAKEDFIKNYEIKKEMSDTKIKYMNWKVNNLYFLNAKEKKFLDHFPMLKLLNICINNPQNNSNNKWTNC